MKKKLIDELAKEFAVLKLNYDTEVTNKNHKHGKELYKNKFNTPDNKVLVLNNNKKNK